jgi:hypothetical protein
MKIAVRTTATTTIPAIVKRTELWPSEDNKEGGGAGGALEVDPTEEVEFGWVDVIEEFEVREVVKEEELDLAEVLDWDNVDPTCVVVTIDVVTGSVTDAITWLPSKWVVPS